MLKGLLSKVSAGVSSVINGAKSLVSSMAKTVSAGLSKMVDAAKSINDAAQKGFESFMDMLGEDEQAFFCGLERGNVWDEAWNFMKHAPFRLLDYGFRKFNKLSGDEPTIWETIRGGISSGFESFGNFVNDADIPVVSDFVGAFTGVREGEESTVSSSIGSFLNGLVVDGAGGLIDGVATMVSDPLGTIEGLNKLVAYSDEMIPAIGNQIGDYIDKDLIHGNADTRSEFAGRAVFEVASWLIGAGEAKAGIKAGSSGDDIAKLANYSDDIAKASNYSDEAVEAANAATKLIEGVGDDAAEAAAKSSDDIAKLADDLPGDGVNIKSEVDELGKAASNNIDDFINGSKKFEEALDDYAKAYADNINANKPWTWDDSIPGGSNLTKKQRSLIKQQAIDNGLIPKIEVTKVEGMKYGFADFDSAGVVKETVNLPESMWKMSDAEQFKWLDKQIGGAVEGYTWHHTEIPGKMELVPTGIHNIVTHNGGRTKGMWADAPR